MLVQPITEAFRRQCKLILQQNIPKVLEKKRKCQTCFFFYCTPYFVSKEFSFQTNCCQLQQPATLLAKFSIQLAHAHGRYYKAQENGICIPSAGLQTAARTALCLWRHSSYMSLKGTLRYATTRDARTASFAVLSQQKKKEVNVKQRLYVTHVYVNTAREEKRKCFEQI